MTGRYRHSIRGYLTRVLLLGAGLFIACTALLLDWMLSVRLKERFDADLRSRAQALVTLTKVFDTGIELDFAGEFMPEFEEEEGPEYFEIWLPDGRLLERSESLGARQVAAGPHFYPSPVLENHRLPGTGACRLLRMSFLPQHEDADVEGELNPARRPEEALTLYLMRRRDGLDRMLWKVHLLIWGALSLLLLMVVVLVRFALRRGLAPLEDVGRQVRAINPRGLDTRIKLSWPVAELEPVVAQLNAMLDRVNEGVSRERRFSSDVAHELRTPLAELRTLCEVGARDPEDQDMVVGFFSDVHDITLEMQELVSKLLDLSRCDNQSLQPQWETLDLGRMVDKVCRRAQAAADARAVVLDVRLPPGVSVRADERLLEQILQNLINNAVAHGAAHGVVTVRMSGSDVLAVCNQAPELTEADLGPMFDRFWQKERARTGGKSAGLGLSLVQAFSDLMAIEVEARLVDEQLEMRLLFPRFIDHP